MKALSTMAVVGSILLLAAGTAVAQVKTIPGEMVTSTATIEAIEKGTRTLTIKNDKGIYETMKVGADITRFDALKVGDRITVRYYDNVVVRLKKPGEAAINLDTAGLTKTPGAKPGGTLSTQTTLTVTVTAIDPTLPSITVKGPNGYVYSRRVEDKKALAQVKVGDQLDITWTEALAISVEPAK
jgi:hypothetical protein